jgi:LuxR family transcriptional regulator, regulator of acetate metabolism
VANKPSGRPRHTYLSPPEAVALRYVAEGKQDKDIAKILGKEPQTVKEQVQSACRKLGAETRAHAVALWLKGQI